MKIDLTACENVMAFNAITSDGEIVTSGRSARYTLATSPKVAAFIVREDGTVLASSVGGVAWIPTREGLAIITATAEEIAEEASADADTEDGSAWERHLETFEPA